MAENSTELNVQSGEQAGAVDQQESYNPGDFGYIEPETQIEDDSQDEVVDHPESQEEAEGAGESEGEGDETKADPEGADQDPKQNHEDNAAAKQARLRAQREAAKQIADERRKAEEEADKRIAESGVLNPYTNKPFSSVKEFEEYGRQVNQAELEKKAKETGRSVAELQEEEENRAYIRKKRQEESEEAERIKQKDEIDQFVKKDLMDFVERYPEVDVMQLDNNPAFKKFCGSRYLKEPLADLYEDFISIVGESQRQGATKAQSKAARSTGAGQSGGEALTPQQKRELERWNAENPEMAMTPKEFLSRE